MVKLIDVPSIAHYSIWNFLVHFSSIVCFQLWTTNQRRLLNIDVKNYLQESISAQLNYLAPVFVLKAIWKKYG